MWWHLTSHSCVISLLWPMLNNIIQHDLFLFEHLIKMVVYISKPLGKLTKSKLRPRSLDSEHGYRVSTVSTFCTHAISSSNNARKKKKWYSKLIFFSCPRMRRKKSLCSNEHRDERPDHNRKITTESPTTKTFHWRDCTQTHDSIAWCALHSALIHLIRFVLFLLISYFVFVFLWLSSRVAYQIAKSFTSVID